jgi:isoaspartyl peptidase/L-asparaginase-like protein (Ntn-hydrolase superfamily)
MRICFSPKVPIYGCGCWAADKIEGVSEAESAIAVSTTGVGEMMAKMQWASECAACIQSENHDTPIEAMKFAIQKRFLGKLLYCEKVAS